MRSASTFAGFLGRYGCLLLLATSCSSPSPSPTMDLAVPPDFTMPAMGNPDLALVTWSNFAQQFFQSYCVSCHRPGGQASLQDFDLYAVAKANAVNIRCGTAPDGALPSGCSGNPAAGQFPIGTGAKPSDTERLAIVAWIDAGAPM